MSDIFKKGKKNKLKIGDKVQITREQVEWFSNNLAWLYGLWKTDEYHKDEKYREIPAAKSEEVLFWMVAYHAKIKPRGKVTRYGADDDIKEGRKNVRVELVLPKKIEELVGKKLTYVGFFCEDHLEKK